MNMWLVAATALLLGIVPCVIVAVRAPLMDALVALNLIGLLTTLDLMLLAEGFGRAPFYDLAVALAVLSAVGTLVFTRFLERWV